MLNSDKSIIKFYKTIFEKKWTFIFISILAAVLMAIGAKNLKFTNDYRVFFGNDNPELVAFEELEESYSRSDGLLFVLIPKDGIVFKNKTLQDIKEFTRRSWQIPHSTRVDSITNFQHTIAQNDELLVRDLVPEKLIELGPEQIAEVKRVSLSEPALHKLLITDKSDLVGISVSVHLPGEDPNEVIEVAQFARKLRSNFKKDYPDYDIKISGIIALNNAFAEIGISDATRLTPIMYLVMMLIMALILRSFMATLAALVVIIFSIASAMGLAGFIGINLTPPSAIAPTVILTLAIADSVHILISLFNLMSGGLTKSKALLESLKINLMPVFLTSLTTIVGFLCLNFSDSPPFHDLGNITAIGVIFAFLYSVILLPCLVLVLPIKVTPESKNNQKYFAKISTLVVNHSKKFMFSVLALFFVLLAFVPKIEFNDQFIEWFGEKIEFRNEADYVSEKLTGIYNLQYSLKSKGEEGIHDPVYLQKLSKFTEWWRSQPEVQHVSSYSDVIKRLSKSMHNDKPEWYKLPKDEDLAAQYLLLYEMSLPFGLDLNNQVDIAKSSTKLIITIEKINSTQIRNLADRGNNWLEKNAPEFNAKATGPSVMFSHISKRNINSMLKGTLLAFLLITILMIITLKSFKYGLISLIPNVLPALMAFGLWSLLFKEAGMAISIVASATLGIIVDDSVHFLAKFLRAKRVQNYTTEQAIHYAFTNVGLALVVTSVILVCGFIVLSFSNFLLNWSLGFLSAITIIFALIVDFLLLPPLLLFIDKSKKGESKK